nr:DNA-directed RNA polymerase I subunit RPA12 isoform X2 [Taeniopygia guttata]
MEPPGRFRSRPEFCPECGSVLPRPGPAGCQRCPRCGLGLQSSGGQELPPLRPPGNVVPHAADALGRRGADGVLHLSPLQVPGEGRFLKFAFLGNF